MTSVKEYIQSHWQDTVRLNPQDKGRLLGLPKPYTVPCIGDFFQEMYYWDTYFTNVGLILSSRVDQAKNNCENMAALICRFGFMPNGNRTYYLNRSQPPFFSRMVAQVYRETGEKEWLEGMWEPLCTEYRFWQEKRMTDCGLNRYYGYAGGEVTKGENGRVFCTRLGRPAPQDAKELAKLGESFMSFAESGWDCNSRFGLYAQNGVPADLNALLYGMEKDLEHFAEILNRPGERAFFEKAAEERAERMRKILWNEEIGAFCDYDFAEKKLHRLASCAAFYPMTTGLLTKEEAAKTRKLLEKLEFEHGVACCEAREDLMNLQWDYPNGWACLHYMVVDGLFFYGYREDALRIAEKYVRTVERNFESTGNLWEKYNVVTGEVAVNKEYKTPPMMGWSAGIYLYCRSLLDSAAENA